MATESEGKQPHGRTYEQLTRDGTGSAGSMGTGGTGNLGNEEDGARSAGRTDDLLAGSAEGQQGFTAERSGELQTGMGGIGSLSGGSAGNRQAEGQAQPGGSTGGPTMGERGEARLPESGGQRIERDGERGS